MFAKMDYNVYDSLGYYFLKGYVLFRDAFNTKLGEDLYQKVYEMAKEIDSRVLADIDMKEVEKFKETFRTVISQLK